MATARRNLTVAVMFLLLVAAILGQVQLAQAQSAPDPGPPTGDGVNPVFVDGNPTCATLNANNTGFPDVTSNFGFKIDQSPNGTFTLTDPPGELTGGAPSDPNNSITISNSDGTYFDWASTLGIDAVIVKASSSANAYVYVPEDTTDTDLHSPINPNTGKPYEISHIEFCYDYELTASKTANAQYKRTYTWTINKSVEPASHSRFAGESFSSDYDVVVDQSYTDSDFVVSGEIVVNNPTPLTVSFSVADSVGGIAAAVSCPTYELAPGASTTCTYSASLVAKTDGTNTATITSSTSGVGGATATMNYAFGEPTDIAGYPTINVNDSVQGSLGSASGDKTIEYTDDFACPTDPALYTNGVHTFPVPNIATIYETGQSDDANVSVTCYAPVVTKDAAASYDETHTWSIEKSVTPASPSGIVGDVLDWTWIVNVSEVSADSNFAVNGTISVYNPAGEAMTVDVSDMLNDGTIAAVDCDAVADGDQTSLTVAAGDTGTCSYSAAPGGMTATLNTATATLNGVEFSGVAVVNFIKNVIGGTATVVDTEIGLNENLTAGEGPWERTGSGGHTCSSNAGNYGATGSYSGSKSNTATVTASNGQTDSDGATTNYICYAPVVTKTAAGLYDKRHTWHITKSVDPTSQSGYPGDDLGWTWTVTVWETPANENFRVSGNISVQNPSPDEPMMVDVADVLGDGTIATVDCDAAIDGNQTSLTVAAGAIGECSYSAAPMSMDATLNTATATLKGVGFSGTKEFGWIVDQVFNGTATVTDLTTGLNEPVAAGSSYTYNPTGSHTCSTSGSDYGTDGSYSETVNNTATVTGSDGQTDSASSSTTYTCQAGFVDLKKLTQGVENPAMDWRFALYYGPDGLYNPDGSPATPIGSSSTKGDADGVLDFGYPALSPEMTYTVCELEVPSGYSSFWQVWNGVEFVTVIPYNPDEDGIPPEDLGNRCVDFGAGTTIPVVVGQTVHFQVDNTYPGGDPRTPGYWKNWNTCTGGGQADNAYRNGGWQNGFWLLEDVLDPDVGGGITWDDILSDAKLVNINSCEQAVEILDQRIVKVNGDIGDQKKLASDAARTLAMHLLAAQLNLGAGACTTADVNAKALEAEMLLDGINFDGTSTKAYLTSKDAGYAEALELAAFLDGYNNGEYCGSLEPAGIVKTLIFLPTLLGR